MDLTKVTITEGIAKSVKLLNYKFLQSGQFCVPSRNIAVAVSSYLDKRGDRLNKDRASFYIGEWQPVD